MARTKVTDGDRRSLTLTADTVTDKQIRELLAHCEARFERGVDTRDDRLAALHCMRALGRFVNDDVSPLTARARCAEILNARIAAESSTGICGTCGERIATDGTCGHVNRLLSALDSKPADRPVSPNPELADREPEPTGG